MSLSVVYRDSVCAWSGRVIWVYSLPFGEIRPSTGHCNLFLLVLIPSPSTLKIERFRKLCREFFFFFCGCCVQLGTEVRIHARYLRTTAEET